MIITTKYKLQNGFTKKEMIEIIDSYNNGKMSFDDGDGVCVYKDGDNHCAVGCFIPHKHKGMDFHGGVVHLLERYPGLKDIMPLEIDGLRELQMVHDHMFLDTDVRLKYRKIKNVKKRMITWINDNVE